MSSSRAELFSLDELREDATRLIDELPRASTRDEALDIAIKAAEVSMRAMKLATDSQEKSACKARVQQLMQDAERIKHDSDWKKAVRAATGELQGKKVDVSTVKVLNEPVNSRQLPNKEELILLRAGYLNGTKFPPWRKEPQASEFELKDGEDLFLDEFSELPLSDFQHDVLDDWKRPNEALPPPSWFSGDRVNLGPSMHFFRDIDLVQDAATDCSVVASLCAGVARGQRGHAKMLQKFMYPYDNDSGRPSLSRNGKYIIRMNFNGCYRKVEIDDRIPTSSTNRVIHVIDRNNPGLLWPALMEKAYLKVRGGYDFPGSNSGTDLWILTGWIPEQVNLQADDLEPDKFWKQISNGFSYGDVLITMGTGKMSKTTERALGLAGEHDYAVLDLREVEGQRLFLIKNPWVEGPSWRGRFKNATRKSDRTKSQSPDGPLITFEDEAEAVDSPRDLLNEEELTPGTFWMDLDTVLQHFEFLYLNWNTGLFKYRQDVHFYWDMSEPLDSHGIGKMRGPHASLQHNPQYTVSSSRGGTIWVLLWRHFQNSVPEDATADEIESGRHHMDLSGYISLIAFTAKGKRVMLGERYLQKLWYLDSPQTLLKLEDCEPNVPYTIVPLEQDLPAVKLGFTISTFCNSPISLGEATPRYLHSKKVTGRWTKHSAGGNTQLPTYYDNPQYLINVEQRTTISLLLEACNSEVNVNVKLLHGSRQRLYRLMNKDILVDSGDYRPGSCLAELEELLPGQYTIICSTFEAQDIGDFSLLIQSSRPVSTELLPREGAGRIRAELSTVAFKQGETKVAAPVQPRRLMNFYAIARHYDTAPGSPRSAHSHIRLSVELGRGPTRRIMIASNNGEYSESAGAVRTDPIDLGPDFWKMGYRDCWIVLDRMYVSSESQEERFQVELFLDQPDAVDVGVWRAWDD
ncbi:Calpain-like protease palB/RIM13 [Pseudocercospora fuligena]|uniref:Calpain-like protease palB/RIM13 n=1 Tax=Pseudocercospora fuligena TaxID=685502 RepID=A0A8H6RSH4_9PEZI|nr:Calpain-like protease palB/RIM13 [Pseudocercospora fuligena]